MGKRWHDCKEYINTRAYQNLGIPNYIHLQVVGKIKNKWNKYRQITTNFRDLHDLNYLDPSYKLKSPHHRYYHPI